VPEAVAKAAGRALAKNPEERFRSCADFGAALGARSAEPVTTEAHPAPQATLVVLPFANRSGSADDEYFSDGLTDELISDLSKVKAMRVISRTSASKLKGTAKDLSTIGRELNVRYVLAGTVRRAADALRITAELVDTSTDAPVWSEKYSGTMADVFDLQERISRQIVAALAVTLTPEESRRLAVRPVTNVQAYECYLRAKHLVLQFSAAALDLARAQVERALELTGDNALLLATLAYIQYQYVNIGVWAPSTLEVAERHATRAVELDPDLPLGYLAMANIQEFTTGQLGTLPWFRQAVARGNDVDAMAWASISFSVVGEIEAALPLADRAAIADPLNWAGWAGRWTVEFYRGHFGAALEHARHALGLEPNNASIHFLVATCLMYQGGDEEVLLEIDGVGRNDDAPTISWLARVVAAAIRPDRDAVVHEMAGDLARLVRTSAQFASLVAACYARLYMREEALDWMAASIERGFVNVPWWTQHDPFFAPYRQDPEFLKLIDRAHELRRTAGLE
jgi:non-specific serine/threonine protein kinase